MIYLYLNVVALQLLARSQIFFHSIVLCSYATVYFCTIKVGQQTKTMYIFPAAGPVLLCDDNEKKLHFLCLTEFLRIIRGQ